MWQLEEVYLTLSALINEVDAAATREVESALDEVRLEGGLELDGEEA